jgi:hypothetical protein
MEEMQSSKRKRQGEEDIDKEVNDCGEEAETSPKRLREEHEEADKNDKIEKEGTALVDAGSASTGVTSS